MSITDPNVPQTGHDAAMVAKVDEAHAALAGTQPEQKVPAESTEGAPAVTQPAAETPPEKTEQGEADKVVAAAGLDMVALQGEFAEKGELSAESLAKLGNVGITPEVVSAYIEGQKALAAQRDAEGYALVGGQEQFQAIAGWAGQNWTAAEREAYNEAVTSGNQAKAKQAILGLKAAYEASMGADPKLASGASADSTDVQPFASRAEVVQAMRDPRYNTDPAYRAQVERRLDAMSSF